MRFLSWVSRLARRPSLAALLATTLVVAATSWESRRAGGAIVPGGLLDETTHLLTTLLVLWALGRRACDRFLAPALVASVVIDVDHIPQRLGSYWLTAGTARPYTHSLLTVAAALVAALLWQRRRDLLVGVAIGLALHLWWDLSESDRSGVPLLWPFSYRSFTLPYASYPVVMILVVGLVACRLRRGVSQDVVGTRALQEVTASAAGAQTERTHRRD